eukprot:4272796-Amphidinium_carterae.1
MSLEMWSGWVSAVGWCMGDGSGGGNGAADGSGVGGTGCCCCACGMMRLLLDELPDACCFVPAQL